MPADEKKKKKKFKKKHRNDERPLTFRPFVVLKQVNLKGENDAVIAK